MQELAKPLEEAPSWKKMQSITTTIAEALGEAWDKRNAGDIDSSYDIFLDLMAENGLFIQNKELEEVWEKLKEKKFSNHEAIDFLLLEVSFLRNQRNLKAANAKVLALTNVLEKNSIKATHRFYQQSGLNALAVSNLSKALECFLLAKKHSANAKEFHLAYLNSILCMEDLSLEFKNHLNLFLKSFEPFSKEAWTRSIQGQIQALKLRSAFKSSTLQEVPFLLEHADQGEQATYYASWLSKLPTFGFVEQSEKTAEKMAQYIANHGFTYLTNYRMRTINFLLVEEDLNQEVNISEKIERFYLWTWQWLIQPSAALLEKIFLLKTNIQKSSHQNLSYENYQLMELSLRWLGLFSSITEIEILQNLNGWSFSLGKKILLLDYEKQVLDYLYAVRNKKPHAEDSYLSLIQHPAQKLSYFSLPQLLDSTDNSFSILKQSIADLKDSEKEKDLGISVELLRKRIFIKKKNEALVEILSPVLSQLLFLFSHTDHITKQQLAKSCFGIKNFDSFIHDPKIANLLSKANKQLAPFAHFQTKNNTIYASFDKGHITYLEKSQHALLLANAENSMKILLEETKKTFFHEPEETLSDNLQSFILEWKNRQAFEELLSISKATAARLLKTWVEDGLAIASGNGKSTKYKVSKKLVPELQKLIAGKDAV